MGMELGLDIEETT